MKFKSAIEVIISVILCLFLKMGLSWAQYYVEYDAPGDNPFGMTWDGNYLWINDKSMSIYQVDISDSFKVVGEYYFNGWGDLAWDGTSFWEMGWSDLRRYEIVDSSFTIAWSYDYRPDFHHMAGIDWDGKYLWVSYNAGGFYRLDPSENAIDIFGKMDRKWKVAEFREGPACDPWNFVFTDDFLWVVDLRSRHLIKCARDSTFSYIEEYSLPGPSPSGIAWDGEHLWTCDDYTGKVYKHLQLTTEPLDPEDEILSPASPFTEIDGSVTADTHLSIAESPYLIPSGLSIENGTTLTIDPGVKIFLAKNAGIVVNGTLKAIGTADSLITFSHQDANESWGIISFSNSDTSEAARSVLCHTKIQYLDGIYLNGATPEIHDNLFRFMVHLSGRPVPGTTLEIKDNTFYFSKLGIRVGHGKEEPDTRILIDGNTFFNSSAIAIGGDFMTPQHFEIFNNRFQYSLNAEHLGIDVQNTDGVYIHDNIFQNSRFAIAVGHSRNIRIHRNFFSGPSVTAIDLAYNAADVSITNNTITDCQRQAILLFYNSEAEIHYNNIYNNDVALSLWSEGADIDASYNWWGTTDPDSIENLIEDYNDDPTSGRVNYLPFLDSPADNTSNSSPTISSGQEQASPRNFLLLQNYPNPFNTATAINFIIPSINREGVKIILKIYNVRGQVIRYLLDERMEPGSHSVVWDGKDNLGQPVASGIYFYELRTGEVRKARKMIVIR